jgi:hypothetical protein
MLYPTNSGTRLKVTKLQREHSMFISRRAGKYPRRSWKGSVAVLLQHRKWAGLTASMQHCSSCVRVCKNNLDCTAAAVPPADLLPLLLLLLLLTVHCPNRDAVQCPD